jgi:hypothetical protein
LPTGLPTSPRGHPAAYRCSPAFAARPAVPEENTAVAASRSVQRGAAASMRWPSLRVMSSGSSRSTSNSSCSLVVVQPRNHAPRRGAPRWRGPDARGEHRS